MRTLALLFVLANLAYLAFTSWIDNPPDLRPSPNPIDANAQRLILAKERDAAIQASTALSKQSRQVSAASVEQIPLEQSPCISVGPFPDLASAVQASATIKSQGRNSQQRLEQGHVWVGYWVSVPGFDRREEAEAAVTRLKQQGMSDAYVSVNGAGATQEILVSLGVFKESERAHRLLGEAKALGFPAQITDRTRAGSVYWIDVEQRGDTEPIDYAALGAQPGKIVRLEQRACPR